MGFIFYFLADNNNNNRFKLITYSALLIVTYDAFNSFV